MPTRYTKLKSRQSHLVLRYHSTETLLLKFFNDIFLSIDKGFGVVVMFLDLSAAFDTVDHSILLSILESKINIKSSALEWFRSYLKDRTQQVAIQNVTSERSFLNCGVPQGSILGPVLFNIYLFTLYNIFSDCGFQSIGYADDNCAYMKFAFSFQQTTLTDLVPRCMDKLSSWMSNHFLKLNDTKTEIIIFSSQEFAEHIKIHGTMTHTGQVIRFTNSAKYLGVYLDDRLDLDSHINAICSSSYRYLRKVSSIRSFITQSQTETLIHAFVSSRLDYCNAIFVGLKKSNITKLQRIQNACVRVVCQLNRRSSVSPYLRSLHWLPVNQRIVFKNLLIIYKVYQ